MKCIIPLAGPDIYTEKYGLKPAYKILDEPLLIKAIHSRHWYGKDKSLSENDLIFVVRESDHLNELRSFLQASFPKGKQVVIPALTRGALLSALAGVSLIKDFSEPIVVDLVDILFNSDFDPSIILKENVKVAGIIPYFISDNPKYSYLVLDGNSNVLQTKEKEVISNNASVGVYFFRNIDTFLNATKYSLNNHQEIAFNNLLFLCPSFNGIINNENTIKAMKVKNVNPVSSLFNN